MADGLDEVGAERVAQQRGHRARRAHFARRDRRALIRARDHDAPQPGLEVVKVRGQAEGGHDLAGGGDVKAVLTRRAVLRARPGPARYGAAAGRWTSRQWRKHTRRGSMPRALPCWIWLSTMAHSRLLAAVMACRSPVKCRLMLSMGHHLGIAAARRAALHAKDRAQRGLAQGQHGVFADAAHAVGQSDGYGGLALARRGGVDGRHQHQLCALRQVRVGALVNLGYIPPIGRNGLRQKGPRSGRCFQWVSSVASRAISKSVAMLCTHLSAAQNYR